jgi:NAD+ synthase
MKKVNDINIVAKEIVDWVATECASRGAKNVVLGMSGGVDSTITGTIAVKALGPEHVFGIYMPKGVQVDIDDARKAVKAAGIRHTLTANLQLAVDAVTATAQLALGKMDLTVQSTTNCTPRTRTAVEYMIAQNIPDSIVLCTANLSELVMGYYTMWADMGSLAPLAELSKTEVRELGMALGLPKELVFKTPSDGLTGQSDEEKMGFSYAQIDTFIRGNIDELPEGVRIALADRVKRMEFKRKLTNIPAYVPAFRV